MDQTTEAINRSQKMDKFNAYTISECGLSFSHHNSFAIFLHSTAVEKDFPRLILGREVLEISIFATPKSTLHDSLLQISADVVNVVREVFWLVCHLSEAKKKFEMRREELHWENCNSY